MRGPRRATPSTPTGATSPCSARARRDGRDPRRARDRCARPDVRRHRPRLGEPRRVALRLRRHHRGDRGRRRGYPESDELGMADLVRPLHPAQWGRLRLRRSGAGTWLGRGRRRPSPACRPVGAPSSIGSPTRWCCAVAEGRFDVVDAGLARAFELLDATSGAQFIGPIHAAAAERELWRHRPREALALAERGIDWLAPTEDWVQTMRLCRVAVWAAARPGRSRHERRATPPGSTTHVPVSPALPRGWTSSTPGSRAPAAVASWPPTG